MKCVVCKNGSTKPSTATVTLERSGTTLVFKDVPADVCENCGEEYVSDTVTQTLLTQAEQAMSQGVQLDVRHFRAA